MSDPDNFLEGTGKYRKHLKIFQKEDIKNKKVEYYIKQSFKLIAVPPSPFVKRAGRDAQICC